MKRIMLSFALCVMTLIFAFVPVQGDVTAQDSTTCETDRQQIDMLVLTETGGFRHNSIPAGNTALQSIGENRDWVVVVTNESDRFDEQGFLDTYDVVIFNNTSGDILDAAEEAAFEAYIRAGGNYMGIHAASDTEYDWAWYGGLVGAYFAYHPPGTFETTIDVDDPAHSSADMLPTPWVRTDEWYRFQQNPGENVNIILSLDEQIIADDLREYLAGDDRLDRALQEMQGELPIAWYQLYDGGRSFYTAMGHTSETYNEPLVRQHLEGGLDWLLVCPPQPDFTTTQDAEDGLTFEVSATVTGGVMPYTYVWNFGDGNGDQELGATASVTYATGGTYTIELTVMDRDGVSTTTTQQVTAVEPEPTETPTEEPTPTDEPTTEPTDDPEPTDEPTAEPTDDPQPTDEPTAEPTGEPTTEPTDDPQPTDDPTAEPTDQPEPQGVERVAPADGAVIATGEQYVPRLQWRAVDGADWYAVYVATADYQTVYVPVTWYSAQQVCDDNGLCTLPSSLWLAQTGEFTWWMTYWSQEIGGEWVNLWNDTSFSLTMPVPGQATGTGPSGDVSGESITLEWNAAANALWYQLWIGPDSYTITSFRDWFNAAEVCNAGTCTLTLDQTLMAGNYEFWLQAWNPAGVTNWQQMSAFSVTP